jgi:hypothetical protein
MLLLLIAALLVAGTIYGGWFLWQSVPPAPTASATVTFTPGPAATDTPTLPATATSTGTLTPTATDTSIVRPTDTLTVQPTDVPTLAPTDVPTETPTYTPPPAVATDTSTPPASLNSPTPTPTVTYPAPTLVEPADGAELSGIQRFTWQWSGPPLAGDLAFDLRIWSQREEQNGWPRRGAITPTRDTHAGVNLPYAPAIADYGSGDYYWSVVVVKLSADATPKVVGAWSEKRRFVYSVPRPPVPSPRPTPTRIQP